MRNSTGLLDDKTFLDIVAHTPLISIDLVPRNSAGEILLGLRKNQPAEGYWFVPGGRVLKNEPLSVAFLRLTEQELGLAIDINKARLLGVFEHIYDTNFADVPGIGTHYVVIAYCIELSDRSLKPPTRQHECYRWFNEMTVRQEKVHPYTLAYFPTV